MSTGEESTCSGRERATECETIARFSKYAVVKLSFIKGSFVGVVGRLRSMDLKEEERRGTVNITDAFERVWL